MFGRDNYMEMYAQMVRDNRELGYKIIGRDTLIGICFEENGKYKEKIYLENDVCVIARFLTQNSKNKIVLTTDDYCVITTMGEFLDLCCDDEYKELLVPELVKRQPM